MCWERCSKSIPPLDQNLKQGKNPRALTIGTIVLNAFIRFRETIWKTAGDQKYVYHAYEKAF
jgi:hypothetical protein